MWKVLIGSVLCILWTCSISISSDEFLDVEFEKKIATCGGNLNLTTAAGHFELKMHNLSSPCTWRIAPIIINDTVKISLFFTKLYLLDDDSVRVYSGRGMGKNKTLIETLHGQNGSVTIVTDEEEIFITLEGSPIPYSRIFSGQYQALKCAFTVPPSVHIMHSPISSIINDTHFECAYTFTKDIHVVRAMPAFIFDEFNFTSSTVQLDSSTYPGGQYKQDTPMDFFPKFSATDTMTITVNMEINTTEYYKLRIQEVDSSCSGMIDVIESHSTHLASPHYELDNGSLTTECRWVIKSENSKNILGLIFEDLNFESVYDVIAVNDGPSENSIPLLQVTTSSRNISAKQMIRSSGQYMWISFKPITFASMFSANVTVHGQGGYFKNSGSISMTETTGNDTIFLLEVEEGKVVQLNFNSSSINPPGKLDIYDGFDQSNLLASLRGNIWYPVLGRTSRLMAIATGFSNASSFSAHFNGVSPGCLHMSTLTSENYILNEHCAATCYWIIPPQDSVNSVLALDLQYVSLKKGDSINILKLDPGKTLLGNITSQMSHVPQLVTEASVGALVKVEMGKCENNSNNIVLIGHSSYMPACGKNMLPRAAEKFQISSPRYPDTYPVLAECQWKISVLKNNLVHMAFNSMKLASNHCIKISSDKKNIELSGSALPDDIFLHGETMIEFNSKNCKKSALGTQMLVSDNGFMLDGTVADCGAILEGQRSGEFNTSTIGNKSLCVWKVSVPPSSDDSAVNIITFSYQKKDSFENYDLHVYDGASIREHEIKNDTGVELWSRSKDLIVVYKRLNVSQPSSIFVFKYNTLSCNSSMQCDNKICMHPDWRCNGNNDCGDYSDEKNCDSVPMPPVIKQTGYSNSALWGTAVSMIVLGVILGVLVHVFYQKRKNGQYRQFGNISVIE